jgi:hypothetical protein
VEEVKNRRNQKTARDDRVWIARLPCVVASAVSGAPRRVGLDVNNSSDGLVGVGRSGSANEYPVLLACEGIEGNLFEILPVHEIVQRVGSAAVIGFVLVYSITNLLQVGLKDGLSARKGFSDNHSLGTKNK